MKSPRYNVIQRCFLSRYEGKKVFPSPAFPLLASASGFLNINPCRGGLSTLLQYGLSPASLRPPCVVNRSPRQGPIGALPPPPAGQSPPSSPQILRIIDPDCWLLPLQHSHPPVPLLPRPPVLGPALPALAPALPAQAGSCRWSWAAARDLPLAS